jgi:non-heme chloroperoxidase
VDEDEAHKLYDTYAVPGAGAPIFQAATANVNPWTEDQVDTSNSERGPLLIISSDQDHTVPFAIADAAYKRQVKNPGITEIKEMSDRGHSLTIDHGWQEVAETALAFVKEHTSKDQ